MPTGKCLNREGHSMLGNQSVRLEWDGKPLVREAVCPFCGAPLRRATRNFQILVLQEKPPKRGVQ